MPDETVMTRGKGQGTGMNTLLLRTLMLAALLLVSCGGIVATSATTSPTLAPATATATPSALATVASPSPAVIAASDCTSTTASTRQVVERLFALSTSNDTRAVTDCFAQSYRDKNADFSAAAADWSHRGPATDLVITFVDVVNGCDRFKVTAKMPNHPGWNGQQAYAVGAEAGRARIYDSGTAMAIPSLTTAHCP